MWPRRAARRPRTRRRNSASARQLRRRSRIARHASAIAGVTVPVPVDRPIGERLPARPARAWWRRAYLGEGSPADPCRPMPTSTSTPSSTRLRAGRARESLADRPVHGDGTVTPGDRRCVAGDPAPPADLPRRGRVPRRVRGRRGGPTTRIEALGAPEAGVVAIDLAEVDARPGAPGRRRPCPGARGPRRRPDPARRSAALASIPPYWLIARRYRRARRPLSGRDRLVDPRRPPTMPAAGSGRGGRTSSGSTRAIS